MVIYTSAGPMKIADPTETPRIDLCSFMRTHMLKFESAIKADCQEEK